MAETRTSLAEAGERLWTGYDRDADEISAVPAEVPD